MKKQILDKYAILYGALTALIIGSMVLWEDIFLFLYVNDRLPLWMMDMNRAMVVWHNEICLILWPGALIFWTLDALEKKRETLVYAMGVGYMLLFSKIVDNGLSMLFQLDINYFHRGFYVTEFAPALFCFPVGLVLLYLRKKPKKRDEKIGHKAIWFVVLTGYFLLLSYACMMDLFGIKSKVMYHINQFFQYGWLPLMILIITFFAWKNSAPIFRTAAAAALLLAATAIAMDFFDRREIYLIWERGIQYGVVLLSIVLGKISLMRQDAAMAKIGWAGSAAVMILMIGANLFYACTQGAVPWPILVFLKWIGVILLFGWAVMDLLHLWKNSC
ncbi:MAG: hypothetical protein HFE80_02940 [Clostridiaceae bacterium]|jgi:hypothetical protein|nr:hypothetical protein [Clostridiaceae bacterium]